MMQHHQAESNRDFLGTTTRHIQSVKSQASLNWNHDPDFLAQDG
jgi:hypothetical protein